MSKQTKAMLSSWLNVFISTLIAGVLTILTTNNGVIPMDSKTWLGVVIAAVVAVLPVIKNYFDKNDPRYGKGAIEE